MRTSENSGDLQNLASKVLRLTNVGIERIDTVVHKGRWIIYMLVTIGGFGGAYYLLSDDKDKKEVIFQTDAEKLIDGFIHARSNGDIEERLSRELSLLSPDQITTMIENDIPKLKNGGPVRLYLMLAGNSHMTEYIRVLAAHNVLKRQAQNLLPLDINVARILADLCSNNKNTIEGSISILEKALIDAEISTVSVPDTTKKSYETSLSILKGTR